MRFLKQLFFIIIWLAVLSGIGYLGYRFLTPAPPQPTCGANCLPTDLKPISVRGDIKIIPVATSTDHASILVQLQNLNVDYAAKSFGYDLKLTGQNGFSKDITGNSYIYAGELKYLVFPNIEVGEPAGSLSANFEVQNEDWAKDTDFPKPTVFLQNQSTNLGQSDIKVTGRFTNGAAVTLDETTIVALVFTNSGALSGISQTDTSGVASGETRDFTVVFPLLSGVNVSNTQVFIYPRRP